MYKAAWADFLSNKILLAERRAAPFLHLLPACLEAADASDGDEDESLTDQLVTLADLCYIAGAARADASLLERAISAYDAHLRRAPSNLNAMRMRGETLLRCRRYAEAFDAFTQLYRCSLSADGASSSEVAPFQLVHDAEAIEDAVRRGADSTALSTATNWRNLAEQLQLRRHKAPVILTR